MTETDFEEHMARAEQALQAGDAAGAKDAVYLARVQVQTESSQATLSQFRLGGVLYGLQEFESAASHFLKASELSPELPEPWQNLGLSLESLEKFDEAINAYTRATEEGPDWVDPWKSLGCVLARLERSSQAIASLIKAHTLNPHDAQTAFFLANSYLVLGDAENAIPVFEIAINLSPNDAEVFNNYGQALDMQARLDEAEAAYHKARKIDPDHYRATINHAQILRRLNHFDSSEVAFRQAINLRPEEALAYVTLGGMLQHRQRNVEAVELMLEAAKIEPEDTVLVNNLAISLASTGRYSEAKVWYDKAIELLPNKAGPYVNYATMLEMMEHSDEALVLLQHAAKIEPTYAPTYSLLVHGKLRQCQWSNLDAMVSRIISDAHKEVAKNYPLSALPFVLLALPVPLDIRLAAARQLAETARLSVLAPDQVAPFSHAARKAGDKLRIGYMSPDFRMHSVGMCFRAVLEGHDRDHFEFFGYHMAQKSDDESTEFFRTSFDHFRDIRKLSPDDAAQLIHDDGIDILIDLAGPTRGSRFEILALRPAPLQVHYLGYGATTGADYVDYLITDETVMDAAASEHCSEKLAYMPDTFMPPFAFPYPEKILNRAKEKLPEDGFVFANFSAHYKIEPEIFSVWMRLLKRTPGSVLWLVSGSERSEENLKKEAKARGVDPQRLVIAPRCGHVTHLARHHLADLCLDNYYHAGGATTLEALWCDRPVLTQMGPYPNSRTGAGMLNAAGLPELVAKDLSDYSKIAMQLASSPEILAGYRQRMVDNKVTSILFDKKRYAGNLEKILLEMWRKHKAGAPPANIRLDAKRTAT